MKTHSLNAAMLVATLATLCLYDGAVLENSLCTKVMVFSCPVNAHFVFL